MKIILAGTPEFSVPIFETIINNFEVVAIVSQPDKQANRGYKVIPTPVKLLAKKYNIPLYQPNKIGEIYQELSQIDFDVLLTCAFGQYIPSKVLKLAKKCAINIHGSLLPKYRGAAPIQYSLLNNDPITGISLIYMTDEMDAGDILETATLDIDARDTSDSLFVKMSNLAQKNIVNWLNNIQNNQINPIKQDASKVALSPKLKKEDALLTNDLTCDLAYNKIRAFSSNPGAYIIQNNKRIKIYYAAKEKLHPNALKLDFCDGCLYAIDYQFESKKRVVLE
ncbi:methionyl-tRNA formyltransferase [Mycoplasma sp. NEAQ87857]|uniref:methionyl-tRNA formyltransferase n=1 Tax=Mycoplasma sp. NEAQ87857 TaxID=2683967 RepID=UPI001317EB05|nr:methionyl-tRNA formyltransferase [Mycoplasma sp. NEAQ87857]QGZ97206.1 methionyl-tRNA formyltransferase [Mycoplasma sp. NEAQ87857]